MSDRRRYEKCPPPHFIDNGWVCNVPGATYVIGSIGNNALSGIYDANMYGGFRPQIPAYQFQPITMKVVGDTNPMYMPIGGSFFTDPCYVQQSSPPSQQSSPPPQQFQSPQSPFVEVPPPVITPVPLGTPVGPSKITVTCNVHSSRKIPVISSDNEYVIVDGYCTRTPQGHREVTINDRYVIIEVNSAGFRAEVPF